MCQASLGAGRQVAVGAGSLRYDFQILWVSESGMTWGGWEVEVGSKQSEQGGVCVP